MTWQKCVLAGKTKISACPCLSISKFPSVLCTAQSEMSLHNAICLFACWSAAFNHVHFWERDSMAIRCVVWELKRSFGHSCQQATCIIGKFVMQNGWDCLLVLLWAERRETSKFHRQIKFTGLLFVTMFDLTELFTIGFKRRDLHWLPHSLIQAKWKWQRPNWLHIAILFSSTYYINVCLRPNSTYLGSNAG